MDATAIRSLVQAIAVAAMAACASAACACDTASAKPVRKAASKPMTEQSKIDFAKAQALEKAGRTTEAIPLYEASVRQGNGFAAKELGEIYDLGRGGAPKDYGKALEYYAKADQLGVKIPRYECR
jgi:TPR repeat protein